MANEQCFDRPLIKFDLRACQFHCSTHRDGRLLDGKYVRYISARVSVTSAFQRERIYPYPSSPRRQTCTTVPDVEFGS